MMNKITQKINNVSDQSIEYTSVKQGQTIMINKTNALYNLDVVVNLCIIQPLRYKTPANNNPFNEGAKAITSNLVMNMITPKKTGYKTGNKTIGLLS